LNNFIQHHVNINVKLFNDSNKNTEFKYLSKSNCIRLNALIQNNKDNIYFKDNKDCNQTSIIKPLNLTPLKNLIPPKLNPEVNITNLIVDMLDSFDKTETKSYKLSSHSKIEDILEKRKHLVDSLDDNTIKNEN